MNDTSSKILLVFAVIGGLVGFHYYADYKIDKRINDPEFLYQLSKKVRPILIFDTKETIHADMGAGDLIESIKVTPQKPDDDDYEIIITPKTHLPYAPLIESIDDFRFLIESKRGKGNEFIYLLNQIQCNNCDKNPRFKIEILKTH